MSGYALKRLGDTGLVVEFGAGVDRALSARVLSLARRLEARTVAGVLAIVPTFRSLLVRYDPLVVPEDALGDEIAAAIAEDPASSGGGPPGALWRLPVCFDPAVAMDVEMVAEEAGLTVDGVAEAFAATEFHAYMLGFLPGQPYLGDLPPAFDMPRLQNPRMSVPAGSVGIATRLVCVYPDATPCGWRIVGRTPAGLWRDDRAVLAAGDRVRFEPVSLAAFEALATTRPAPQRLAAP
ncbi:MAG TPA: allophanate hydrolase subunit 1 [Beijerinckiaceae bacterium]|jgi:KipI family sensor histidine kinase inhibitor